MKIQAKYTFLLIISIIGFSIMCYFVCNIITGYSNYNSRILMDLQLSECKNQTSRASHVGNIYGYPKIIHRIYGFWDTNISKEWKFNCYESCHEESQGFVLMVWNKTTIIKLLHEHYPWFINTFNAYQYEVQRVDAARYFILHQYGGLYMDMDLFCRYSKSKNITAFFKKIAHNQKAGNSGTNVVVIETEPKPLVSNFLIASKRCDTFMNYVIQNLAIYNYWYILPYPTVMFTTGPGFLTLVLRKFKRDAYSSPNIYRLPKEHSVYELSQGIFWKFIGTSGKHGTWHSWDASFLLFFNTHYTSKRLICLIIGIAFVVFLITRRFKRVLKR